jgi:hypothetical protein
MQSCAGPQNKGGQRRNRNRLLPISALYVPHLLGVTPGSPVIGLGELDPIFPQFHTNSNGLGSRHNAEQCLLCHSQPTLGGSGGFLVPNPGQGTPQPPENPMFRLVPNRFGKKNVVPSFETQNGPIREVRFQSNPDGSRDGSVHQLWVITGINNDPTIPGCNITQPDFATQLKNGNLSFRIPLQRTPTRPRFARPPSPKTGRDKDHLESVAQLRFNPLARPTVYGYVEVLVS